MADDKVIYEWHLSVIHLSVIHLIGVDQESPRQADFGLPWAKYQ
jgi:hypothetical protein